MNTWIGISMLASASLLYWLGLPDREGVHRRFLRFSAAQVLYPPLILVFVALGIAAIMSSISL
jgi:hypothetical protein